MTTDPLGDDWGAARALLWLVSVRWARGNATEAVACCEEAVAAFRRLGDRWQLSQGVANAGVLAHTAGDLPRARAAFVESLALARQLGYQWFSGVCLVGLAAVAAAAGEGERAARLLGAAAVLREVAGEPLRPSDQAWHDRAAATARNALGEADFAVAWAAGAALPPNAAIAEALIWASPDPVVPVDAAAPAAQDSLTPREIEVLCLLAEGKSDREIAAVLCIARTTASNHVAAIRAKLDVPSRAAAVAYAVRHRLV